MGVILTRTQKKHPTPVLYAISIHLVGKMQLQCISYFEYTQMISSIFSLGLTAIIHTFEYALSIASHQPSRLQTQISLHLNLCCSICGLYYSNCDFDVDYMATDVIYSLVFIFGTTTRPLVDSPSFVQILGNGHPSCKTLKQIHNSTQIQQTRWAINNVC